MATESNLHWVDYVVIVGYFALVIAVGIISSMKVVLGFIVIMFVIYYIICDNISYIIYNIVIDLFHHISYICRHF